VDFLCGVEIRRSLTGRRKDPVQRGRQWAFGGRWICLAALGRNGTARPGHYYFRSIAATGKGMAGFSLILEAQLVVGRLAPSTRMIFVGQFLLGKKYGRAYYSKSKKFKLESEKPELEKPKHNFG